MQVYDCDHDYDSCRVTITVAIHSVDTQLSLNRPADSYRCMPYLLVAVVFCSSADCGASFVR